ncbi:MAG: cytochrome c oxidase subunit II [Phyllobacteriaceae bacterium]|nr:cytochrome c oxidase subunit II [Phyllobacteriaceae bacterium]
MAALAGLAATAMATLAQAAQPTPWQMDLQPPATAIMEQITWFEHYTLWFIVPITFFVLGLLIWVLVKFRASANPNPSRTSHNTVIELIWTIGPVIILLFIAVPSFQLLTAQYSPPEEARITIKAIGNQWNWDYEYQFDKPVSFNSAMLKEEERDAAGKADKAAYPRLLAVDNEIVVPVNTTVRLLITASDVIHAFAVPAFGIKVDAMPGRINEGWFKATKEGLYYGQCSELCGQDHAFMPIAVRVVAEDKYNSWVEAARSDVGAANKALMASLARTTTVAGN